MSEMRMRDDTWAGHEGLKVLPRTMHANEGTRLWRRQPDVFDDFTN